MAGLRAAPACAVGRGAILLSVLTLVSIGIIVSVLYAASWARWLTAHPMYNNAVWGRRFLVLVGAATVMVGLVVAAWTASAMQRRPACRVLLSVLVARSAIRG